MRWFAWLHSPGSASAAGLSQESAGVWPAAAVQALWKQEVLWTEASVSEVAPAGEQLFHLVVDISGNRDLMHGHTKAGQSLQMKVGECQPVFMAIASPPVAASKGYLEFLVKDIEGATAGVLCDLYKGDRVELSQMLGKGFNVDQVYPVEHFPTVLLFATGTGISPIRSLIELGIDAKSRRDVRLYYGARNLQRMAYQDKFKEWEASGIRVIPVLSQPNAKWNGEQGYVQVAFPKSKALTTPAHTGVFLCGHKAMAEASCDNNKRPNGMTLIPWKDMVWDITCVHPCTFSPCNVDCSGECSSRRCWKTRRLKSIRVWLARIIFALLVLKCWGLGDHPLAARFQKLDKG